MITNDKGRELIKRFETCQLKAYLCPAGVPTIGYGHTEGVHLGQVISQHYADVLFDFDIAALESDISAQLADAAPTSNEFSALVSFAFNVGENAEGHSTLLRKFLAGDVQGAVAEFGRWVHAKGKVLPGLVARRAAERDLFLEPDA